MFAPSPQTVEVKKTGALEICGLGKEPKLPVDLKKKSETFKR